MVVFPEGYRLEVLGPGHDRRGFASGRAEVDEWLHRFARQSQEKHLSSTNVLIDEGGAVAGYYTLAIGAVDVSDLPPEEARRLPRRAVPVVTLAWLGVRTSLQGRGLGARLFAAALEHCRRVRSEVEFVAVLIDALDVETRAFYEHFDFKPLPGHPLKLFLGASLLDAMCRR